MWLNSSASPFLLTGFPGLEKAHRWLSIPVLVVYVSILLGNGALLFLIRADHNLHEPVYSFLAMLAATDLGVTLTTMPTVLGVLWLNHREIGHRACFSQAYFIHTLSVVESGVLLAMAYDRFIAICNPQRYASILTNTRVLRIGVGVLTRAGLSVMPVILRLPWFPSCRSHVLSHAFCLHQDVIKVACANVSTQWWLYLQWSQCTFSSSSSPTLSSSRLSRASLLEKEGPRPSTRASPTPAASWFSTSLWWG